MEDRRDILRSRVWVLSGWFLRGLLFAVFLVLPMLYYWQSGLNRSQNILACSLLLLPFVFLPLTTAFARKARNPYRLLLHLEVVMGMLFLLLASVLTIKFWFSVTFAILLLASFVFSVHEAILLSLSKEHDVSEMFTKIGAACLVAFCASVLLGDGVMAMVVGNLQALYRYSVALSWSYVFYAVSALLFLLCLCNLFTHPKQHTFPAAGTSDSNPVRQIADVAKAIVKKTMNGNATILKGKYAGTVTCVLFLLFYFMPEVLLSRAGVLFVVDSAHHGGLGLSPQEFGLINGTIGIFGLLFGGLTGVLLVRKYGLKRCLWPMVIAITLPDLLYVYMASYVAQSLLIVDFLVFVERFGCGFGLIAFALYIVYNNKERSVDFNILCTVLVYLAVLLPGLFAGSLLIAVGYRVYFIIVSCFSIVTYVVTALVKFER